MLSNKLFILALLLPFISTSIYANEMIFIPGGEYLLGSDREERNWAYQNSPDIVGQQQWYDTWESNPRSTTIPAFMLDKSPVTQREYEHYLSESDHREPTITQRDYQSQGFLVHPYSTVKDYLWNDNKAPKSRLEHPIVLVSKEDAGKYCASQGKRLPSEDEWEAACRGMSHNMFPWGNQWIADAVHHNNHGTAAINAHPLGKTPDDIQELLGNVFEWTSSTYSTNRSTLKSCSWDDAPGTCRCAFRHGRPSDSRHILIGFRCAKDYK